MKTHKSLPLFCTAVIATVISGCATYQRSSDGFDASMVDKAVTLNKTTVSDVRAVLGTPTVEGTIKANGQKFIGYGLVGNNAGASFLKNWGKGVVTLGFGSKSHDFTIKNVYFVYDKENRITSIKKNGYAFLSKNRLTHWNECEVKLTDAEVNSPTHYSGDEICKRYAQEVAKTEHVDPEKVDTGKEFEWCNIPCHTRKGAFEAFGELTSINDLVSAEEGDGKRANELYGEEHLSTYTKKQDNN